MSILITGGAGYIGSHAVRELIRHKKEIVVYDNLSKGHREAVKGVPLVEGALGDTDKLSEAIKKYGITGVMHFAASIEVSESMKDPQAYYTNNVCGALSLLKAMLESNVKKIIFSSTAAVYGEPEKIPIKEDTPLKPTNVYGRTKLVIEHILSDYAAAYGLKYISLRYFNVAGADEKGDIGEDHNPETHLIPLVLKTILGQRESLSIFGTDYPTEDGTCVRDYIHVTDLAQAHILALNRLDAGGEPEIYNLGNGKGFSVLEIIKTAEKVTGKTVNAVKADRRPGDPARLVASSEKIKKELGWEPRFYNLERIIESAWNWHKNHLEGYSN
jgi:UDP-glucose 4-epimerase